MSDRTPPSIFVDQAVSVALRNNTVRIVLGIERGRSVSEERVELILPVSTATETFIGIVNGINRLRMTAHDAPTLPHQITGPR